jgi:hypothetical protein
MEILQRKGERVYICIWDRYGRVSKESVLNYLKTNGTDI